MWKINESHFIMFMCFVDKVSNPIKILKYLDKCCIFQVLDTLFDEHH